MIIPKPVKAIEYEASRETIESAPTSSVHPIRAEVIQSVGETLFTVPADEFWRIEKLSIYNDHTSADSVDFHLVDDGDAAGAGNRVGIENVPSKGTIVLDYLTGVVMGPGQSFYVDPDTTLCVMFGGITRFFRGTRRD